VQVYSTDFGVCSSVIELLKCAKQYKFEVGATFRMRVQFAIASQSRPLSPSKLLIRPLQNDRHSCRTHSSIVPLHCGDAI